MDRTLDELQKMWGCWADRTFPNSTLDTIASHFREEAKEFAGGIEDDSTRPGNVYITVPPSHDPEEAADCLLLMLHHAHRSGYSLWDEALKKVRINKSRKWDTTDEGGHGHFKHTEQSLHDAEDPTLMDVIAEVKIKE